MREPTDRLPWLALLALLIPGSALAHTGAGAHGGFGAGMAHPLGGADHVLAMVAVGLWAAMTGGRAIWAMPLAFLGAMLAGGLAGAAGLPLPAVEPVILSSSVILGVVAAQAFRPPLGLALAAIAVFGLAHGHAHGTEGPGGDVVAYAAGFIAATAALHGAGLALGLGLQRLGAGAVLRGAGAVTAIAGLSLWG